MMKVLEFEPHRKIEATLIYVFSIAYYKLLVGKLVWFKLIFAGSF
jgi:hypothetical protein